LKTPAVLGLVFVGVVAPGLSKLDAVGLMKSARQFTYPH
jgi:hypothetical protein